VIVNLGSKGGYAYKYFSDYEVNVYDDVDNNLIIINVGDKVWPGVSRPGDFDKEVSEEEFDKSIGGSNCEVYSELISKYAKEYDVNPILVLAVMMQESGCNRLEDNGADVGLMQINLESHCGSKGLSSDKQGECREQLKDSRTNIRVGAEILNSYSKTFSVGVKESSTYKNNEKFRKIVDNCIEKYPHYGNYILSEAILRAYNGWGCGPGINTNYVEEVNKKYASLREEVSNVA